MSPTDPLLTTSTFPVQTTSIEPLKSTPTESLKTTPTDPLLTTPTLNRLNCHVIPHVCLDWQSVGHHLEVHPSVMKVIDDDYHNDVEKCCRTMFTRWLSHDEVTGGAPRLWRTVLKALKNVGYTVPVLLEMWREHCLSINNSTIVLSMITSTAHPLIPSQTTSAASHWTALTNLHTIIGPHPLISSSHT